MAIVTGRARRSDANEDLSQNRQEIKSAESPMLEGLSRIPEGDRRQEAIRQLIEVARQASS